MDIYIDVPYNIAPVKIPAKAAFPSKHSQNRIHRTLGLLGQGVSGESDTARTRMTGRDFGNGR